MREGSVPGDLPRPAPIRVCDPKDRSLALFDGYQGYPGEKMGSTGYDGYKEVKGNKLSALVDRNGLPLPARLHWQMFMIPGFTNQRSKCLRFLMCRIAPRSSPLMQPTMPERFVSTTGTEESRAISRSTRDPGDIQNEEGQSGSIWNFTRSAMPLNGSSVGLRHLRRFLPDMNAMRPRSSG